MPANGAERGAPGPSSGLRSRTAPHARRGPWLLGALALFVSGCAVGPDFKSPEPPAAAQGTSNFTPFPLPEQMASADVPGGAQQHFRSGQEIQGEWWTMFRSDVLDQLIRAALAQNPNVASAQAALRQAQQSLAAQNGALRYPNVGLQAQVERQRTPVLTEEGAIPFEYTTNSVGLSVSYQLDLFGGNRRTLEGLAAAVDYQRFQLEGTYLTLVSNVILTAIQEASLRAQLKTTLEVLDLQKKSLDVVRVQFNAGAIAKSVLLTQQTEVAQTEATVAPLQKGLSQARHQLAIYLGRLPNELGIPEFDVGSLQLPEELPVSLPSALVRQRPDIRASEALLHQASAQVGVATAALYPQVNLSATYGSGAAKVGDLFDSSSIVWNALAGLTQPVFNGGALTAKKRAAEAAYDQSAANYRSTVLGAFKDVADALRAVEYDATTMRAQAQAEALAAESLKISAEQYKLGAVAYLQLLEAQRAYSQARIALVQAQAARFSDTVALYQSLGGGWWNQSAMADVSRPGSEGTIERPTLAPVQ